MKFRAKSSFLTFLLCFPLLVVAAHDLYFWVMRGGRLHLSEFGYLLQHYTPYENNLVHLIDHEIYRKILKVVLNAKAVIVTAIPVILMLLWVNRPRRVLRRRYR